MRLIILFVFALAVPATAQEVVPLRFEGETGEGLEAGPETIADVRAADSDGQAVILFELDAPTAFAFAELTGANVDQTMTVFLCGEEFISVTVRERIEGGKGIIPAPTEEFARTAANVLRGDATCDVILAD